MSETKRALLLIGSPREESSSGELGGYLLGKLASQGWATGSFQIRPIQSAQHHRGELLDLVRAADLLILAFPLYVDSLPAAAIRALEWIAEDRAAGASPKSQRLVAICNCGFPEPRHTDIALTVCRRFAMETGIDWAGGLGLGAGSAVAGQSLEKTGGMLRNVRASLDLAGDALAQSRAIPDEAVKLMVKPLMPAWLYSLMGGLSWWFQARPFGTQWRLHARPYEQSASKN